MKNNLVFILSKTDVSDIHKIRTGRGGQINRRISTDIDMATYVQLCASSARYNMLPKNYFN